MISDDEAGHQVSYWPSISDLFMTLFITAIALLAVLLFVFLVNPVEPVFKGQIIELRNLLGLPNLPQVNDERYQEAFGDTIRKAIEKINACNKLGTAVDVLASCQREKQRLADENVELIKKISTLTQGRDQLTADLSVLHDQLSDLKSRMVECKRQCPSHLLGKNDKPPIITIASDVLFPSGGALVSSEAAENLRIGRSKSTGGSKETGFPEIAAEIIKRNTTNQHDVDTLEIIGHTDRMPMKANRGNLDADLPSVLDGTASITSLKPGSNNDLGLLRALAIKQAWQVFVTQHPHRATLEQIRVRTYSAGQTIPVNPSGSVDDADSRRIELRLTKLGGPSAGSVASPDP
jgi:flagellar motor protein MotB